MSFLVVQRTHELGVRMALGAQRRDILRLVVGHAAKLILTGTLIGLAFAFATTHLLAAMLYHVSPHDLSTFAFVTRRPRRDCLSRQCTFRPPRHSDRSDARTHPHRMIRLHNIERSYPLGRGQMFYVLRDIDLDIAAGDFVSVMGPSGAGKSTLLHILGMHDHGWTGEYFSMRPRCII